MSNLYFLILFSSLKTYITYAFYAKIIIWPGYLRGYQYLFIDRI